MTIVSAESIGKDSSPGLKNRGSSTGCYAAHIGGFVAGLAMGLLARMMMKEEPDTVFRRQYERETGGRRYW